MGLTAIAKPLAKPNSIITKGVSEEHADRVKGIISSVLGEGFATGAYKRTHLLTDVEDIINITVAILLKYNTPEIKEFVNKERKKRGLEAVEIDKRDIYNFKKVYAGAIDNAWIATATYIGDLYPMADKIHRIGVLNDIVEKLLPVREELMYPDDMILKKANLLLKALDRINIEMGNNSLQEQLKPRQFKPEPEKETKVTKQDLQDFFLQKFGHQLPMANTEFVSEQSEKKTNDAQEATVVTTTD